MSRRILHSVYAGLLALLGQQVYAQAPEGPQTPVPGTAIQQGPESSKTKIVTRVTLVNTPVIVRDDKGRMVTSLEEKDFQLSDHGVPQKITHFDVGGEPISMVVLVESSDRIEPLLPGIRKSGIVITDAVLGPTGEAAVLKFDESVEKLTNFTKNADAIQAAIGSIQPGSSESHLYDAMAAAVEMLSTRPQTTSIRESTSEADSGRRRVMLIISEASDVGSSARLNEVLRRAQLANVTIYSVGLSTARAELQSKKRSQPHPITPPGTFPLPPQPGVPQTPDSEAQRVSGVDLIGLAVWAVSHVKNEIDSHQLEVAAAGTGGTHIATFKNRSIETALDEIGGELHAQYMLAYSPEGTPENGFHEISVTLSGEKTRNLKVRARPGYYVGQPED